MPAVAGEVDTQEPAVTGVEGEEDGVGEKSGSVHLLYRVHLVPPTRLLLLDVVGHRLHPLPLPDQYRLQPRRTDPAQCEL